MFLCVFCTLPDDGFPQKSKHVAAKVVFDSLYSLCAVPICHIVPIPAHSKAWVCGRSLTEVVGSNTAGGMRYLSVVSVVCCQVEFSASG